MVDSKNNIAIVLSCFNRLVVDKLYYGAIRTLEKFNIKEEDIKIIRVPGAFEIPIAVKTLLNKKKYCAVITLGAIIKGETSHFEFVANECARGVAKLSVDFSVPVIFGVLTVDNLKQAMDRAGEDENNNKGSESALAALDMINVLRDI